MIVERSIASVKSPKGIIKCGNMGDSRKKMPQRKRSHSQHSTIQILLLFIASEFDIKRFWTVRNDVVNHYLVMAVACNSLPFTIVNSEWLCEFLRLSSSKWGKISDTTLRNTYLKKTVLVFRKFILSRLSGKAGCLIVDEIIKNNRSFYCLMISSSEPNDRVYFWRLVESPASTREEIASLIIKIIEEIEACGVRIVSYATDNCPAMKAIEQVLRMSGRYLKRVPCGAQILNGVFKDFINSRSIKPIWDNVAIYR